MNDQAKIVIFDTTLRDGEQSPGASMTSGEKLHVAQMLEKLRVDVIEAGFANASKDDFAAIQTIARTIKDSRICSLARATEADIRRAGEAIQPAVSGRIHTFIASSPIHMQHKLGMRPEQVLERAREAVGLARKLCEDVEFSPEDASRSETDFLCRLIEIAIDAGARTINIPDTVGYGLPQQFGELIRTLIERIPNSDRAIFSVHCHNDLGLAVANSLAAVQNGARQVECTINGLGERSGNAALEELVMAIRTRNDLLPYQVEIDATQLVPTSRLVSQITGFAVQPNKAIVGVNAFAHESGIHQDGVIKHRETYEIMHAADVGWVSNQLVLGKHSGRNALRQRLAELNLGIEDDQAFAELFARFKELADKKHEVFDDDLHALVNNTAEGDNRVELIALSITGGTQSTPNARVGIIDKGEHKSIEREGNGVVDATFCALRELTASKAKLELYSVNNITSGTDAQGEVSVRLAQDGRVVNGKGVDTDIVVASAKAYIAAINALERVSTGRMHAQAMSI